MQTSWSPGTAWRLCRACTPTTAWPALMAKCFFANCPSEEGQHPLWPPILNFSFVLDCNSFYTFSAKNASKCRKTLSNGKSSPNPLIQDPTTPDLYQGEDGLKLSAMYFYHRLHCYPFSLSVLISGESLACCCIYWAGLIAPICRSQRYWWLWNELSTNDNNVNNAINPSPGQKPISSRWPRPWLWRPLWSYLTCLGRWCSSARWCLQRQIIFEPISRVWRSRLSHLCFSL